MLSPGGVSQASVEFPGARLQVQMSRLFASMNEDSRFQPCISGLVIHCLDATPNNTGARETFVHSAWVSISVPRLLHIKSGESSRRARGLESLRLKSSRVQASKVTLPESYDGSALVTLTPKP